MNNEFKVCLNTDINIYKASVTQTCILYVFYYEV